MGNVERMIRVEAKKGETRAEFDERDREEAFRRAAHLLDEGFPQVRLWLWGRWQLPLIINKSTYEKLRSKYGH